MIILKIIIIFEVFSFEFNIKISTDTEPSTLRTGIPVDCVQCAMWVTAIYHQRSRQMVLKIIATVLFSARHELFLLKILSIIHMIIFHFHLLDHSNCLIT